MGKTFKDLKHCFKEAIEADATVIGVVRVVPDIEGTELVITSKEDFVDKLAYYATEFNNDELKHRYVDNDRIVNFAYGKSLVELEEKLMKEKAQ
ncbi:hypothetical protein QMA02_14555 [Bacillus wiedmannii]|uniref:hypothetical protein n=1 Tax=Bacillus wiedmannii TaxID=1890302 RepID=UPI000B454A20|nr:hypothetical protein [Bacillus wiedmannii]MDA1758341.1 hypothetical protein [Bacillus cereus]MDI6677064.1 hypothetical protein [Bacillus wiedmannii]OUB47961.1 hypothetical protein BK740_07420 [Bacillus thuringiensis serovar argentinensis]